MDVASPGQAPPSARSPRSVPGGWLGRYELVVLVREDDGGSAWLAREKTAAGTERLVALRIVSLELAADERFRELLRQEVKLAIGVSHPNVAQVLELGSDPDGTLFLASEWVDGESFSDLRAATSAKKVAIPTAIVLRILADACAGLHAAHLLRDRNGGLLNVVHGDFSPRSLVIATNGVARVVDLGFAKAKARLTGRANIAWSGEDGAHGQRIDRHADVWGGGAVLAQALGIGSRGGADGIRSSVPPLVSDLVVRARSNDPAERFATAAEMQGAIEAAMVTLGIGTTRGAVAAFAKEHVGDRTLARAEAVKSSRSAAVLSVPTPPVDSVPATAQSVRPEAVRFVFNTLPLVDTGSAISRTPIRPSPAHPSRAARASHGNSAPSRRVRAGLFAAGFALALVGSAASVYLALRPRRHVASAPSSARVPSRPAAPPVGSCPSGMVEVGATAERAPPLAAFCIDAAPVTTEAYKACSDSGDCKRAATENRWPGITPAEQAANDPQCHERDPNGHAKEPVNCVDRDMAAIYCAARGARLPTEAEAAFATRGAGASPFSEWSLRPHEAPAARSYAIGFRCAKSL